jgi:hypothetical protein
LLLVTLQWAQVSLLQLLSSFKEDSPRVIQRVQDDSFTHAANPNLRAFKSVFFRQSARPDFDRSGIALPLKAESPEMKHHLNSYIFGPGLLL